MLIVVGLEPTNISVASSPNPVGMNQQTDFTIILTSGGSGSSGLEGKKISISYGDNSGDSTSTSSGGEAQFTHSYSSDDTYDAIVTFAGAPLHICILNLSGPWVHANHNLPLRGMGNNIEKDFTPISP